MAVELMKSLFRPLLTFLLFCAPFGCNGMVLSSWTPIFKGIEHASGTNQPSAAYPNLNVVHAIRVDLQDPDIQFLTSPRIANYRLNSSETAGYTVSDFLQRNQLQLAVNANLFDPQSYYLPAGTPMDILGLSICRGDVVSPQENASHSAALMITSNNVAQIIHTNWPAHSNAGIYTAVSGDYAILANGVNIGYALRNAPGIIHNTNPRTAFGLSQDKRYLFLLTIDGRQSGYSDGSLDFETAAWLLLIGAYDGINLDGGGSTTLVIQNSTGAPVRLNESSAVADSGRERTVGSHFGIYAKPVPAFINDVSVTPDDTSAVITWTTSAPATDTVQYGADSSVSNAAAPFNDSGTNHSITLTGLAPNTLYYYQIKASADAAPITSPLFTFTTTNYVSTNILVDLTNSWKYTASDLDGINWPAPGYDDSGWSDPAPAILWADSRGANPDLSGLETSLPINQSANLPYPTYYFRTAFDLPSIPSGVGLSISAFVDDGAVFYLNGIEVYRLRMAAAPSVISYTDLTVAYPCNGNATCSDDFALPPQAVQALQPGLNVLAVEVHNYSAGSPDITFGASLFATVPRPKSEEQHLAISILSGTVSVNWTGSGLLQEANFVDGPWTDLSESSVNNSWQVEASKSAHYYRLH
jgi:exopolysaccharide biosynthesis protein